MATWTELLAQDRPIVADGAMGTMLMSNGLEFGDPPELWNLEHPEIIRRVQRGYAEAGAQVLLTNTFGGNRLRLELHGREDRVDQLNRTAAVLAFEHLPEGQATVGFEVCIKHVAAAAEGATCTVTAKLNEVVDERKLRFDVEVKDTEGDRTLGVGTHERRVIPVGEVSSD